MDLAPSSFLGFVTRRQAVALVGISLAAYFISLSIYRLFLHPLRKVPGPKLAALTQWVETYYECFKAPGGVFTWEYQKWHAKYGPIVRVGPNEVHIQDPTFYETLYVQSRQLNKPEWLQHRFSNELSAFSTASHQFHRLRRGALNPFFSKRKIAEEAPSIQAHMDRLCRRLESEFLGKDQVLPLRSMWGAFTSDVIANYCFEKGYDFILAPEFYAAFPEALVALLDPIHFVGQFPWVINSLKMLPDNIVRILMPKMGPVIDYNAEMERQILRAKAVHAAKDAPKDASQGSSGRQFMFSALLESDLPPEELSTQRLQHEANAIVGAGVETTMYSLCVASYHVMANPDIMQKLQAELVTAIPDAQDMPSLDALMQLPYLTTVINEALRLTFGTTQRLLRLSPTPVIYTHPATRGGPSPPPSAALDPDFSYRLPAGTVVSMDNYTTSTDPWAFPEPHVFRPDRWAGDPTAPDGRPLTRYLVSFGRGPRSCLGMQLAHANLHIGLATFFRRYRCQLFETDRTDVDFYMDRFVSRPKPGSKGVRVKMVGKV